MKVKEISRTANVAWSPSALQSIHLACGTVAQQLDATFRSAVATRTTYYSFGLTDSSKSRISSLERGWGDNRNLCETGCAESKLVRKCTIHTTTEMLATTVSGYDWCYMVD